MRGVTAVTRLKQPCAVRVVSSVLDKLRKPRVASAARARNLTLQTAQKAKTAKLELVGLVPLLVLTVFVYARREQLFGVDEPVRIATAFAMVGLGLALARALGRFIAPALFRRMDPATAGTVAFLIRLVFIAVAAMLALRIAGLDPATLAVGGAITAVVVGLAAQQTLGNLIAGMVLIAARPFRVGDRVRLQAGAVAGQIEGTVLTLGLLYTTFAEGQDQIMVPNNIVLGAAVVPLREPAKVDLRARLRAEVRPSEVQRVLEQGIATAIRGEPNISLEEVDADEVVVRIQATPVDGTEGPALADEVLAALAEITAEDTRDQAANGDEPVRITATQRSEGTSTASPDDDDKSKARTAVQSGAT
jgi:small conductance mechanosensitive channel